VSVPWPTDLEYATNDKKVGKVHLVVVDGSIAGCGRDVSAWPWRFRADYEHPDLCDWCSRSWRSMVRPGVFEHGPHVAEGQIPDVEGVVAKS
jgi:hypothetical protein